MSFLQPILLAALPLVALPIVIHLINQRRYQTVRWGAMMFLLAANRMSRGYARLRQWLIMLFRMLAIAGLIFAVSRPLASGWLGLAAGRRADTTIIVLDRSPSMQQKGTGTTDSKLDTGRRQLVQTLETLSSSRWVLIESTDNAPRELNRPDDLLNLPDAGPVGAEANVPAMLQSALEYVRANQTGRTDIWICSDLRENDWNASSGNWQRLRDGFLELSQGIRFHLVAYAQPAPENLAVRVMGVRRHETTENVELWVSLQLVRKNAADGPVKVPVQFEIEGARTEVTIEMTSAQYELENYRIPLDSNQKRGWGRVSIPADANLADNVFYFAFDEPPSRKTIVVADDPRAARPLELAASIAPDVTGDCTAEIVEVDQLALVSWDEIALLLWQTELPSGDVAELVESFVRRGGQVLFLPPRSPSDHAFLGVRWQEWTDAPENVAVESWRGDQDLLAHTQSGTALPVGQLYVRKYCGLSGDVTPLATLKGGSPLFARVTTDRGGVYFLATTTAQGHSSLAKSGVVLYVAVQRALAEGAAVLGNTRQLNAGPPPRDLPTPWDRLSDADGGLSTEYPYHDGVYAAGSHLLAVNRPPAEDHAPVLPDSEVDTLFQGLDFARLDDRAGNFQSLIQEIWRLFLAAMMLALIVEAGLCLPKLRPAGGSQTIGPGLSTPRRPEGAAA